MLPLPSFDHCHKMTAACSMMQQQWQQEERDQWKHTSGGCDGGGHPDPGMRNVRRQQKQQPESAG